MDIPVHKAPNSAPAPCEQESILLSFPYNGQITFEASRALFRPSAGRSVQILQSESSALAHNFNVLLATALNMYRNGQITHFAMLHSDVSPEDGWLDVLAEEIHRLDADLVSAVSPIKDSRGVTSTGIGEAGLTWSPYRRFTVRELMHMPETFSAEDLGYTDKCLLHNTGCWIADLRKPIFHQQNDDGTLKAFFAVRDDIVEEGGEYRARFESEDWFFSRRLHEMGAKTFVTRKVKLSHIGRCCFVNHQEWGTYTHDTDTEKHWSGNGQGVIEALVPKVEAATE